MSLLINSFFCIWHLPLSSPPHSVARSWDKSTAGGLPLPPHPVLSSPHCSSKWEHGPHLPSGLWRVFALCSFCKAELHWACLSNVVEVLRAKSADSSQPSTLEIHLAPNSIGQVLYSENKLFRTEHRNNSYRRIFLLVYSPTLVT